MSDANNLILLAGATGYIGRKVLQCLCLQGYSIVCIGRNIESLKKVEMFKTTNVIFYYVASDFNLENKFFKEKGKEFSAIISCLGSRSGSAEESWSIDYEANKNLLVFAQKYQIKKFVFLSAICLQKPKLEFQFAKLSFEKLLIKSGLNYSIIRPTAFFKSLAGQFDRLKKSKAFILFDSGEKTCCKPISATDLANFICDCLRFSKYERKILPVGGPGPALTPRQQGALLFKVIGKKEKYLYVPSRIFRILRFLLVPASVFSKNIKNYLEFLNIGYYYATESMVVWNQETNKYTPENTPEYGKETLEDFYQALEQRGSKGEIVSKGRLF
ncbi:MAG: hypothetical protein CBC42_01360 [Betaproteobacteria bacterium TMED82]|nr:MAG: hypothetical protein CBC42_01360 [Betaproteobacteria bacterium TMED82]|tara:strand:- start:20058 stop:21044 length:987 start_codon:yes stop_codon:yes gene_type:complete